jgi:hypothetical protein
MKNLLLVPLVALTLFSSCAALQRYKCNREYAAKKGMEDADAGRLSMPARLDGASCDAEYSPSDFSKDYNYGFRQKQGEICQLTSVANYGRIDGEAGSLNKPQKAKLGLCNDTKDAKKLEATYEAEFRKAFCAPARASTLGTQRAQAWQEPDFDTTFHDCKKSAPLKAAYTSAYKVALANACTVVDAETSGAAEATAKRPSAPVIDRLNHCAANVKDSVVKAFETSYNTTRDRLAKEEGDRAAVEAARIRQVKIDEFNRNVATTAFPFQVRNYVSRCTVSADRSNVQVEIDNNYPEQVLIQGNWRVIYYNNDFTKLTEDRTAEAVLITGNNRKAFQKMTLPRDAAYCRAEFLGAAVL